MQSSSLTQSGTQADRERDAFCSVHFHSASTFLSCSCPVTLNLKRHQMSAGWHMIAAAWDALDQVLPLLTSLLPAAAEWGSRGSLQELQIMQLDNNAQLGSTLPQWSAAGALPSLQLLSVRSCGLNGTLPASWGRSLRNLSSIILDGNHITGELGWAPPLHTIQIPLGHIRHHPWRWRRAMQSASFAGYWLCQSSGCNPSGAKFCLLT